MGALPHPKLELTNGLVGGQSATVAFVADAVVSWHHARDDGVLPFSWGAHRVLRDCTPWNAANLAAHQRCAVLTWQCTQRRHCVDLAVFDTMRCAHPMPDMPDCPRKQGRAPATPTHCTALPCRSRSTGRQPRRGGLGHQQLKRAFNTWRLTQPTDTQTGLPSSACGTVSVPFDSPPQRRKPVV